ncbi:MAG: hypothetical protein AAF513_05560 [Pseudomonadota bacterium]
MIRIACLSVVLSLPALAGAEVPRLPWGAPDLQGVWTTATLTPLERPEGVAADKTLSAQERSEMEISAEDRLVERSENPPPGSVGGYNREWLDPGMKALNDGRSALIVDPADGRIPWRAEAKAASDAQRARYGVGPFDTFADMDTGERCLSDGVTMAPLQPYNMNYQIFQSEDVIAINHEMYHEYRIIPLDGRDFIPPNVGQWLGDARGHWEGDTLVIVSKGFADKSGYYWAWPWRAARPNLVVTERLRRVDAKTIDYSFTVSDPDAFTQPWTARVPMTTDQASRGVTSGPLFEFACHEGNYALPNVLRGARFQESLEAAGSD